MIVPLILKFLPGFAPPRWVAALLNVLLPGLLIAGALWLAYHSIYSAGEREQAAKDAGALAAERAAHAVTRQSLNTTLDKLSDQSAAVRKLAEESAARIAASDKARAAALEARGDAEKRAAALDMSAGAKPSGAAVCRPSKAFDSVRGEL